LSEGRPILLALFLERVFHGDPTIRAAVPASSPQAFEPLLISHLMSDPQIGHLLVAAGRAPKGVDLELLAQITDLSESEIKDGFEILKEMSFAKTFLNNDRLFLHEEMYAMLERNVYSKEGDEVDADTAAQAIYQYYKPKIRKLNQGLGQKYVAYAADRSRKHQDTLWGEIEKANQELQTLNTEFAFYRWRLVGKQPKADSVSEDPIAKGLQRYYRLGHEASMSNDFESLLWLRFELIRFIQELDCKNKKGEKQEWLPFLRGFLFLQKIWEKNASGKSYEDVLPNLDEQLDSEQKCILSGFINIWKGIALSYGKEPNYKEAEAIFSEFIVQLSNVKVLPWFSKNAIVLAYRQRAHLKKRQFLLNQAIQDFKKAAKTNRGLNFNFEEATIRNDLGDAQVLTGNFGEAKLNLQDAFSLRQKMKNGTRLALSYSTYARYYTAIGAFSQARNLARQGMNLSTRIGRGTALARISFAEATRRYAQELGTPENRCEELFNEAEKALGEALEGLIEQTALQIDARIEQACLYRDRMRRISGIEQEKLFNIADALYLEVCQNAEKQNHQNIYRMADAMANRIWMGMFKQDTTFAKKAADEFAKLEIFLFPIGETESLKKYRKKANKGDKNPVVQFIGKYYVAKGMLSLGSAEELSHQNVKDVATNWMLGLEYSLIFAEKYRGLDSAEETIYNKIRTFNDQEIGMLLKAVEQAEKEINDKKDSRLKMLIKKSFTDDTENDDEK
jgi:tetratricopeptide (TPR) repeat protein